MPSRRSATRTAIAVRATLVILAVAGCSNSRRAAPPPAAPPDTRVDVSVIPPQELKGNRPFFGWETSFGKYNDPQPNAP